MLLQLHHIEFKEQDVGVYTEVNIDNVAYMEYHKTYTRIVFAGELRSILVKETAKDIAPQLEVLWDMYAAERKN